MIKLYKSLHFALTDIRSSGKKETGGILCFKGLPSVFGSSKEICALEDGVVLKAGINYDVGSREHRLGMIVTLTGHSGVMITYGRLAKRFVEVGDYVRAGEVIGLQGSSGTGTGEFLTLEFRKNGRRVDGCEYLGIRRKPSEFTPPPSDPAETVCSVCGISEKTRAFIDSSPDAPDIWKKILSRLQNV